MNVELISLIVSGLASLVLGVGTNFSFDLVKKFLNKSQSKKETESYSEKISKLTNSLKKASLEMDQVLKEIELVAIDHTKSVEALELQLTELGQREQQAKQRIEILEKVPIEVVQQFESIIQKGEKRSAWRDYFLFGLGVVVSTVIAIILNLLG
ncbi:MAG TPA: hypothetical protein DER09_04145 [Prolixibacteraceae bacterium]|nr:hypothetical protein [Prolixibacteraceae bacterium]